MYNPANDTYKVTWDKRVMGMKTISSVLKYDNEQITDEMDVFILNLNLT